MSAQLTLDKISLAFGDRDILRDVDLTLTTGSRIALTGANGSGKSTLMRIIADMLHPDSGKVHRGGDLRVSYLPQEGITHAGTTLFEEAVKGFDYLQPVLNRIDDLETALSKTDETNPDTNLLLKEHHRLQEHLEESGYFRKKQLTESMLAGLGFSKDQFEQDTETFSSGWQMRIALAKTLLAGPEILLLDEPTNYLDLETREWVRDYLCSYPGGFLLVSHDRNFLDAAVTSVAELFQAGVTVYNGNYSAYEVKRKQELLELAKLYEEQQEEIAKTEAFINKFRYNASKAKLVQSRVKWLEKLQPVEIPEHLKTMHLAFPPPLRAGDITLEVTDLTKQYTEVPVLHNLNFTLERGEKLGVVGINGAGKSTLLRIFAGKDDSFDGMVRLGTNVQIGYYAEEQLQQFRSGRSVIDLLESEAPTELLPKLRSYLGAFLFRGDDIYKSTSVLSGGEKSRLAILRIILHPVNLLILDEPTNHLDIHSKEILLEALQDYQGTVVFVSHDRYFLEQLSTKVLELDNGRGKIFYGDYAYYQWKKNEQEGRSAIDTAVSADTLNSAGRTQYEDEKQKRKESRKMEREEKRLLQELEDADREIEILKENLNDPEIYSHPGKAADIQKQIEAKEEEQHHILEKLEELEAQK